MEPVGSALDRASQFLTGVLIATCWWLLLEGPQGLWSQGSWGGREFRWVLKVLDEGVPLQFSTGVISLPSRLTAVFGDIFDCHG